MFPCHSAAKTSSFRVGMISRTAAAGAALFLMLCGLASGPGSAAAAAAAPARPAAPCDEASTGKTYNDAVGAYTGQSGTKDVAKAKSLIEGMIAACGVAPETFAGRVLMSDIALQEKDYPTSVLVLNPVPRPGRGALGVHAAFLMLRLLQAAHEAPSFARERASLIDNSGRLLTAAPVNGSLVESFMTPAGDKVTAYKVDLTQGSFNRYYEFLVEPKGELVMPMTLALSTDNAAPRLISAGNSTSFFLDLYGCGGQTAVKQFTTTGDPPPYDQVKAAVLTHLAGAGVTTNVTSPDEPCQFETFIAPGL